MIAFFRSFPLMPRNPQISSGFRLPEHDDEPARRFFRGRLWLHLDEIPLVMELSVSFSSLHCDGQPRLRYEGYQRGKHSIEDQIRESPSFLWDHGVTGAIRSRVTNLLARRHRCLTGGADGGSHKSWNMEDSRSAQMRCCKEAFFAGTAGAGRLSSQGRAPLCFSSTPRTLPRLLQTWRRW